MELLTLVIKYDLNYSFKLFNWSVRVKALEVHV